MKEDFHLKHYDIFLPPEVHESLMVTSIDDSDGMNGSEYMSRIKTKVINFDKVKTNYLKENGMLEDNAKSVDALYCTTEKICMTEFKNGEFKSGDIIEKALSSVMMFLDITSYGLKEFRKDSIFVLVYNPEKKKVENRQRITEFKAKKSKKRYSKFGLDHLYDFCFGEVIEIEKGEFDKFICEKKIIGY